MSKPLGKTAKRLLSHAHHDYWDLSGYRECVAAKQLVAAGLAKEFINLSGMSGGDYKVSPFTRRAYVTRPIYVFAGRIVFNNKEQP